MKIFALLIICLLFFGCQNTSIPNQPVNIAKQIQTPAPATPEPPQKDVDIPNLVGKNQSEIITKLGKPLETTVLNKTDKTGELSFDYTTSNARYFINFKNGKADYFHYDSKKGFATTFELGDLAGVNLRDVQPTDSNAAVITYSGKIGGIDWHEISVAKTDKGYSILAFQKTP
ncbi:MAG: hypothetical protein KGZ58_01090 [Ignavibacteriales bacterium]|nr:hypothetical protein [Ignavibacteriales bacterium]